MILQVNGFGVYNQPISPMYNKNTEMINEITEFKISVLDQLIEYLNDNKQNVAGLSAEFGSMLTHNEVGTLVINPNNKMFFKIILSVENNTLKSVTFLGSLLFSFSDLIDKYGNYREAYSYYDDLYSYFFNEKNAVQHTIIYMCDHKMNINDKVNLRQISITLK